MKRMDKQIMWLSAAVTVCIGLATWTQAANCDIVSEDGNIMMVRILLDGNTKPADVTEPDKGGEVIVLKTEKAKRPSKFPHWKHQDNIKCATCHDILPEKWSKSAGHDLCKSCHKSQKVSTKCNTCHEKRKKAYEGC